MLTIELFAGNVYCSNRTFRSDGIPLNFLLTNKVNFRSANIVFDKIVMETGEGVHVIPIKEVQIAYNNYRKGV